MQLRRVLPLGLSLVAMLWASGAAAQGVQFFNAEMLGGFVVGGGDPNGAGSASLMVQVEGTSDVFINYNLMVTNIAKPTAAHIHRGGPGQNGPIVATLNPPSNGSSTGVIVSSDQWAFDLADNPNGFYVDVHTTQFPNGAIRGRLD